MFKVEGYEMIYIICVYTAEFAIFIHLGFECSADRADIIFIKCGAIIMIAKRLVFIIVTVLTPKRDVWCSSTMLCQNMLVILFTKDEVLIIPLYMLASDSFPVRKTVAADIYTFIFSRWIKLNCSKLVIAARQAYHTIRKLWK